MVVGHEDQNIRRDSWGIDLGAICLGRVPAHLGFPGTVPVFTGKSHV